MINVGMGQKHKSKRCGVKEKALTISMKGLSPPLEHAAVDQKFITISMNFIAHGLPRSRDLAGRTMKLKGSLWRHSEEPCKNEMIPQHKEKRL